MSTQKLSTIVTIKTWSTSPSIEGYKLQYLYDTITANFKCNQLIDDNYKEEFGETLQ